MLNYIQYMYTPAFTVQKKPWWETQIEQGKPAHLRDFTLKDSSAASNQRHVYSSIEEGLRRMNQEGKIKPNTAYVDLLIYSQDGKHIEEIRVPTNYLDNPVKTETTQQSDGTQVVTPLVSSLSSIPTPKSTPTVIKKQVPSSVRQYVSSVDENGNVFFDIPEGYSLKQFEKTVQEVISGLNTTTKNNLLKDIFMPVDNPRNKLTTSESITNNNLKNKKSNSNSNVNNKTLSITYQSKLVPKEDVNIGRILSVYAYPKKDVHVYSIHPAIYELVLKKLQETPASNTTRDSNMYYITPYQLPGTTPGQTVNDSIYHFIGKEGFDSDIEITVPSLKQYYTNGKLTIRSWPTYINKENVNNGKTQMKVVSESRIPNDRELFGYLNIVENNRMYLSVAPDSIARYEPSYMATYKVNPIGWDAVDKNADAEISSARDYYLLDPLDLFTSNLRKSQNKLKFRSVWAGFPRGSSEKIHFDIQLHILCLVMNLYLYMDLENNKAESLII